MELSLVRILFHQNTNQYLKSQILGWGKTEISAESTERPKWSKIPVVDLLTCIRSENTFNTLTSDRTFCAGNRAGTDGPCNGDSGKNIFEFEQGTEMLKNFVPGGGFVVNNNNKWYLRGIVSASLLDQNLSTCDVKNYAVFTDVTKFQSWIQNYVKRYN